MDTCSIDGCDRGTYSRGWCEKHYRRALRNGGVQPGERFAPTLCAANSCDRDAVTKGYCHGHYQRVRARGDAGAARPLRTAAALCAVQGCDRTSHTAGLCKAHHRRLIVNGDVRADIPIRSTGTGTSISHGYRWVICPPEERHLTGGRRRVLEHRLVMARVLGRALGPDESAHHLNGDRLDNRPENLELWSRWQPSGQRVTDKVVFAVEVLRRYRPDLLRESWPASPGAA